MCIHTYLLQVLLSESVTNTSSKYSPGILHIIQLSGYTSVYIAVLYLKPNLFFQNDPDLHVSTVLTYLLSLSPQQHIITISYVPFIH